MREAIVSTPRQGWPEGTGWHDVEWDDLLDARPERPPAEIVDQVRHDLGIGTRRVRYRGDLPPVGEIRERLEL